MPELRCQEDPLVALRSSVGLRTMRRLNNLMVSNEKLQLACRAVN